MSTSIKIDAGIGELIDKITILEIKQERIHDPEKRKNIEYELQKLQLARALLVHTPDSEKLQTQLKRINEKLWDIEDAIRRCEASKQFDQVFIDLARSVYLTNDQRCDIKRQINQLHGSQIVEEKSYEEYC